MKFTVLVVIAVLSMAFATPAKVTLSGENMPKPYEQKFWNMPQCYWCMKTVSLFAFIGNSGITFANVTPCEMSPYPLENGKCDLLEQKLPEIIEHLENNDSAWPSFSFKKEICSAPDVGVCSA